MGQTWDPNGAVGMRHSLPSGDGETSLSRTQRGARNRVRRIAARTVAQGVWGVNSRQTVAAIEHGGRC